jgi:type IV pilus assembly protein PilZ
MAGKKGFGGGSGGILALEIKDEAELYEHYMSFVSGGGLFVPTKKSHELGDDIFFSVDHLPEQRAYSHDR